MATFKKIMNNNQESSERLDKGARRKILMNKKTQGLIIKIDAKMLSAMKPYNYRSCPSCSSYDVVFTKVTACFDRCFGEHLFGNLEFLQHHKLPVVPLDPPNIMRAQPSGSFPTSPLHPSYGRRSIAFGKTRDVGTWRIIPVSKWLVTPIYKPFRPFIRGITPVRGLTNHGYSPLTKWDDPPSSS